MKSSDTYSLEPLSNKQYSKYTVIGVVFASLLLFSLLFFISPMFLKIFHTDTVNRTIMYCQRLLIWAALGLIILYAAMVEKEKFLLWPEQNRGFAHSLISILAVIGIVFTGCIIITIILHLTHSDLVSEKMKLMVDIMKKDGFLLVLTALTAGIVEELIFRGYLQPRLQLIFGKPWIAIVLSSILFGALHYSYGTLVNVLSPTFIGLVFACYYYKYRNLKVLIIAHFLWDFLVLMIQVRR